MSQAASQRSVGRPRGLVGLTEQLRETLLARNDWLLEGAIPLAEKTQYLNTEPDEHKHFRMFIRAGNERCCCVCSAERETRRRVVLIRHCLTDSHRRREYAEVCGVCPFKIC